MNDSLHTENSGNKRVKKNFLVQAWLVIFLSTFFGVALAAIQLTLSPKIAANRLNETLNKVPGLLLGDQAAVPMKIIKRSVTAGAGGVKKTYSVFAARVGSRSVGYVVKATGQGYADKIDVLIGLDGALNKITGIFILGQKETPGLGAKMVDPAWRAQFTGKLTDKPLKVVKTKAHAENEIDAITGATISSRSLCAIINQAVHDVRGPLASGLIPSGPIPSDLNKTKPGKGPNSPSNGHGSK
ncbi:MAG: FMN-binding protein [Deltaproteobacteria bacterium]|nr:FMN-binding protein [Deltaproteobacteria bacterium]